MSVMIVYKAITLEYMKNVILSLFCCTFFAANWRASHFLELSEYPYRWKQNIFARIKHVKWENHVLFLQYILNFGLEMSGYDESNNPTSPTLEFN